jgi:tripartite-type tricarboxylate transporter receptor subunit TctC
MKKSLSPVRHPVLPSQRAIADESKRRSLVFSLSLIGATCVPDAFAQSSNYPSKPIKIIITHAAGGLPDTVARIYAQRLTERLGQAVVVENKPGANGLLAVQAVMSAPADGYTFLCTDGSSFSINPLIYKSVSYEYKRDIVAASFAARAPLYLAVHPKTGVSNFKELVALAKAKPGSLSYGSSGVGSTHHLSMEAIKTALSLDITHIPFKGSGQSVPALVGGQVDMAFAALPSLSGFVKSGQVKLVANNASKRSEQEPSTPAMGEIISGYDLAPVIGLLAAKASPPALIERISQEMAAVAKMPEVIHALSLAGIEAVGGSATEFALALDQEISRMTKIVRDAHIQQE